MIILSLVVVYCGMKPVGDYTGLTENLVVLNERKKIKVYKINSMQSEFDL